MKQLPLSTKLFISDYELTSVTPVYRNVTNTGKTSMKSQQYQYYKGDVEVTCIGYSEVKKLIAFGQSLNGGMESIQLKLPVMKSNNTITGTPALSVAYNRNTDKVVINNFTGTASAGDYFNIQNDPKLYVLLTTGKAGDVFEIAPSLRKDQIAGARISFDAVLTVKTDDEDFSIKPNKTAKSTQLTIKFTEDL